MSSTLLLRNYSGLQEPLQSITKKFTGNIFMSSHDSECLLHNPAFNPAAIRGGDSLQGRYNFLRLYPLSAKEVGVSSQKELLELLKLGGFPEPFFSSSEVDAKRWSLDYRSRLLEEDIISLERVQDLGTLELLLINLPSCVASPLSLNSLREDLNVAHKTVSKWLGILERLYAIFRLPPFGSKGLRAVKKEQKHYHYDWTLVKEDGRRFENMVGLHLLKWCHFIRDTQGRDLVLKYFRDFDGREVDFVVVEEEDPLMFIECKWQDSALSKALKYLKNKFPHAQFYQISAMGIQDYISTHNIRVCPAYLWLQNLV